MRIILAAFVLLLAVSPAMAQTRYPVYKPLWRFTYYPTMPKAGERKPGYVYHPYSVYRTDYPRDRYDRNKVQRYPVR